MTSHQIFNHPRNFPQTCGGPSCSKESLFSRGRLEGLERSLLAAMPGEGLLDHSDRVEPPRLSHSRPWLLKHLHCVGYGRDHRQVAIEADCNWTEGPHSCRSPRLNAAKREDKGSGCMNVDYREFKESLADAIEAELALLGPGTLPSRTILSSYNRTRPAKSICAPSDAANYFSSSSRRLPTASQAHRDEFDGCEGGDEKIMVVSLGRPLEQGLRGGLYRADVASDLDLEIGSGSGIGAARQGCHVPSAAHRRWSG
ncbi:hypothetical protein NKJ95_28330 [Mesorhizobium sp. M0012]